MVSTYTISLYRITGVVGIVDTCSFDMIIILIKYIVTGVVEATQIQCMYNVCIQHYLLCCLSLHGPTS